MKPQAVWRGVMSRGKHRWNKSQKLVFLTRKGLGEIAYNTAFTHMKVLPEGLFYEILVPSQLDQRQSR